jgi:hypothetical protein
MSEEVVMKKTLLAIMMAGLTLSQAQAKTNLVELSNELEIMTNILQTALKQQNSNRGIRFRSIDTTYLAQQGVLFEIKTTGLESGFAFNFSGLLSGLQDMPEPPEPPEGPVSFVGNDGSWEFEIDQEWEEYARDAVEKVRNAMHHSSDMLRELREQERELAWEQRDYSRQLRDIEFEKRNASEDQTKEIVMREKEFKEQLKELEKKKAAVAKRSEELEKQQQEQADKRNAARKKEYTRFLADFEAGVGDVLCRYGAGIKALPVEQNISFILPDFGLTDSRAKQDKVYVFKQKDIQDCVRDKIDTNKLLSRVETYLF